MHVLWTYGHTFVSLYIMSSFGLTLFSVGWWNSIN